MNSISPQVNPLLFFKTPKALSKQLVQLSLKNKQWMRLAKEFERKPLNLTLENEKFQMLDGESIIEKRKILKKTPLYAKIFSPFIGKEYRERMTHLSEGLFELMQSGSPVILDDKQLLAEQKARVDAWKNGLPKPQTCTIEEDLDTPLIVSLFLGNLHNFTSIENILATLDLNFTGNKADRIILLGKVLDTIGLKTLQDCQDKGISDNASANQYLVQNKKNFKQMILKNHGNVITAIE